MISAGRAGPLRRKVCAAALLAGAFTATAAVAAAGHSRVSNATSHTYRLNFEQKFKSIPCPAQAPAGYSCLEVTGTAHSAVLGALSFRRLVLFDLGKFDRQHPTCIPDETYGTAVLAGGALHFRAPGSVCFADGTASYALIITGGTAAYRKAVGSGRITVPPQTSAGSGRELWQVELRAGNLAAAPLLRALASRRRCVPPSCSTTRRRKPTPLRRCSSVS